MRYILSELDEQEREESFRLKRFKQLKYKNVKTEKEKTEEVPLCCLFTEEEQIKEPCTPPPPKVEPCTPSTPKVEPCMPPKPKVEPCMPPTPKVTPCSCGTEASPTLPQERLDHLTKHLNEILQIAKELKTADQTPKLESFIKCCDNVKGKIQNLSFAPSPRGGSKVHSMPPIVVTREPSLSSKEPSICSKPSEKSSICSNSSEKPSICRKLLEKVSICSKPSKKASVCSKSSEKPSAQLELQPDVSELKPSKTSLGDFETKFEETVRLTRTRNPDGTISEEKQIITIKTEIRRPRSEEDDGGAKCLCGGSGGQYSRGKRGDGRGRGKRRGKTQSPSCSSKTSGSQKSAHTWKKRGGSRSPSYTSKASGSPASIRTPKFSGSRTPSYTSASKSQSFTCACDDITNILFNSGNSRIYSGSCCTQVTSKPIESFKPYWTLNPSETFKPFESSNSNEFLFCGTSKPTETSKPGETYKSYSARKSIETSQSRGASNPSENSQPCGTPKPSETSKPCEASKPTETSKPCGASSPSETSQPCGTAKPSKTSKPCGASEPSETYKPLGTPKLTQPYGASKASEPIKACGCPALSVTSYPSVTFKPCGCPEPSNVSATRQPSDTCTCGSSYSKIDVTTTNYTLPTKEQSSCINSPRPLSTCSATKPAGEGKRSGDKSTYCIPNFGTIRIGKKDRTKSKLFIIASPSPSTKTNSLLNLVKVSQSDCTRNSSNTTGDSIDNVTVVRDSRLNALRKMILPSLSTLDSHSRRTASVSTLLSYKLCLCASSQTSTSSVSTLKASYQQNPESLTHLATTNVDVKTLDISSYSTQSVSLNITPQSTSGSVVAECKAAVVALAEQIKNTGSFSGKSSNIWYPIFGTAKLFKDAMTSPASQDENDFNLFEALNNDEGLKRIRQRRSRCSPNAHISYEKEQCDLVHKVSSSNISH